MSSWRLTRCRRPIAVVIIAESWTGNRCRRYTRTGSSWWCRCYNLGSRSRTAVGRCSAFPRTRNGGRSRGWLLPRAGGAWGNRRRPHSRLGRWSRRCGRWLPLRNGEDRWQAGQRFEINDQGMGSHQLVKVDVDRHGQSGSARRHIQHLTGAHSAPLVWLGVEGDAGCPFQRGQLALSFGTPLEDHRGSCYGDRDGTAPDRTAAGILGDAQQNRAAIDVRSPPGFVEAEDRIRTQPRDGQIGEGQLRARVAAGADAGVLRNFIVQTGVARGCVRLEQFHFANDLRYAGFL